MITLLRNNLIETNAVGIGIAVAIMQINGKYTDVGNTLDIINASNIIDETAIEDIVKRVFRQRQDGFAVTSNGLVLFDDHLTEDMKEAMLTKANFIDDVRRYVGNILIRKG